MGGSAIARIETIIAGFDTLAGVDQIADLYRSKNVVSPDDLAVMERYRTELGQRFCRRCEYCQPCPQGVMITPAMLYGIVAHRMGPAKAAAFATKIMETARQCIQCQECEDKCPQSIPISQWMPIVHQVMGEGQPYPERLPV